MHSCSSSDTEDRCPTSPLNFVLFTFRTVSILYCLDFNCLKKKKKKKKKIFFFFFFFFFKQLKSKQYRIETVRNVNNTKFNGEVGHLSSVSEELQECMGSSRKRVCSLGPVI